MADPKKTPAAMLARGETRQMSRAELIDEAEWMLGADTHPRLIAQLLGRQIESLVKAARLLGRPAFPEAVERASRAENPPAWSPK